MPRPSLLDELDPGGCTIRKGTGVTWHSSKPAVPCEVRGCWLGAVDLENGGNALTNNSTLEIDRVLRTCETYLYSSSHEPEGRARR
jgi:hypothetical protein